MEVWELDVIRVPKSADPAVQAAARNVATWAGSGCPLPAWQDLKNCPRGVVDFLKASQHGVCCNQSGLQRRFGTRQMCHPSHLQTPFEAILRRHR